MCLQDVLQVLGQRADVPWGVHLRIPTLQLLEASLRLLHSAYSREELYRPVWISMEGSQSTDSTNVCFLPYPVVCVKLCYLYIF